MNYLKNKTGLFSAVVLLLLVTFNQFDKPKKEKKTKEPIGLAVGAKVKDFTLKDSKDNDFNLQNALKEGPVVVIFYRGQWCPICNRHLSQLQDSLELIYEKGATVIAISPEKKQFLEITAEKTKASFSLLHDEGYKVAQQFDVVFNPDSATKKAYNTFLKADLKNAHSDDSERLPIPATFIISKDSKVVWRHFDPNYKKRSSVIDIVNNLP